MIDSSERIISFPHMGNLHIAIKGMLKVMGAKVLIPPENNKEALSLGVQNSCETVCLPYKLNLGNYIKALQGGANVLVMMEAPGTCRLGNYASMAEAKLREMGFDFEMVVFDLYKGKFRGAISKFAQAVGTKNIFKAIIGFGLLLEKIEALDKLETALFYYRPREINEGDAEKIYKAGIKAIDKVNSIRKVKAITEHFLKKFEKINVNKNKKVLKVYLTGEFYVLLDPFSNMDIEKELGKLGVEVQRQLMLSDWLKSTIYPKYIYRKDSHRERAQKAAVGTFDRCVGGDCLESIGDAIHGAINNIDGVVHVGPFGCMPEIVSQSILPHISREKEIPVISFMMDEQTGRAGLVTRLEAFVDLLYRKNRDKLIA